MGRGFGALPSFDISDSVMAAALSPKVAQAQAISAQATPFLTDPVVKSVVDGLEQQIAGAVNDLSNALADVAAAHSLDPSSASEHPAGKPEPNQGKYANLGPKNYNYSYGGQDFQNDLKIWRTNTGNRYKPDPEDYQYPGGDGWLQGDTNRWAQIKIDVASAARDALSALLGKYISTVPAAFKADQDLAAAKVVAQTADITSHSTQQAAQTFQVQQNLQQAVQKAHAAAAAVAAPVGPSPLLIAAVVIPVLGVIAYALSRRKKSASVAGYRRRRRSRR